MTEQHTDREIYIAIDPQCVRHNSLDIAILLAERLNTRIYAGLISNQVLRQVALLPFTTEILMSSGEERNLASESVDDSQQRMTYLIQKLLEQRAPVRKVAFRIENTTEHIALKVVLENRQDLFLPAVKKSFTKDSGERRASPLESVKWVYDNCDSSERCLLLLKDLVDAGLTRRIHVFGNKAVPRQVLSLLSESGAQVYWINAASGEELLEKLQTGSDVDLILLTASFSSRLGDERLRTLNQQCTAPILVVG